MTDKTIALIIVDAISNNSQELIVAELDYTNWSIVFKEITNQLSIFEGGSNINYHECLDS